MYADANQVLVGSVNTATLIVPFTTASPSSLPSLILSVEPTPNPSGYPSSQSHGIADHVKLQRDTDGRTDSGTHDDIETDD